MRRKVRVFALIGAVVAGCADSNGTEPVVPPAEEDIFIEHEVRSFDFQGNVIAVETRYIFDDALFRELCVLPDADSFDDYEEYDSLTNEVIIERGTTPVSLECPADGIVTGPLHEELYPSSWCRRQDCGSEDQPGEPKEGSY